MLPFKDFIKEEERKFQPPAGVDWAMKMSKKTREADLEKD